VRSLLTVLRASTRRPSGCPLSRRRRLLREVDRYKIAKAQHRRELVQRRQRGEKVSERGLSNSSVKHTLRHLAQVLEQAVDEDWLTSNPANGKRRRLKAAKPSRPWVEPQQLLAFLDGASGVGRVLLGLLCGTGLRIDERCRSGGATSISAPGTST
jgi:hypothetical protein